MRILGSLFGILFFLSVNLHSSLLDDKCYGIQIGSFGAYSAAKKEKEKYSFKNECRIVSKKNRFSVICECKDEERIRKKLPSYKRFVPTAFLTKQKKEYFFKKKRRKEASKKSESSLKPLKKDKNLNELMYKVFIYNNDLKNAKYIAKNALALNPNDLLWRKRLADILSWSGKQKEAFKHYDYIFEKQKRRSELSNQVFKYGSYDRYFKQLGKIYEDPKDIKKIEDFIEIAKSLGIAKEALSALYEAYKKTKSGAILQKCAQFSYELGDKELSLKYLNILKNKKELGVKSAILLSKILFEKKEFSSSLKALLSVEKIAKKDDKEYWRLLSDLYSYTKQNRKSAEILRTLCTENSCKKSDYDRLISFYSQKDSDFVSKISLKAYREFKDISYFLSFCRSNLQLKRFDIVKKMIAKLPQKEKKIYEKEPLYWLMSASLYENQNPKKAIFSFKKALNLDPDSSEILARYGWFLIKNDDAKNLKEILAKIEKKARSEHDLPILAAAINYKLNRIKKAYFYYKKALRIEPKNDDLKLDFSDFLMSVSKKSQALRIKREIYENLQKKAKKNPNLLKNKKFLTTYLRSSIYFISADDYNQLLHDAKSFLDQKSYLELEISWRVYNGDDDYVKYLSQKLKRPQFWLKSYLSLKKDDTKSLRELLYRYADIMPYSTKIQAQIKTKQIAKAKKTLFDALEQNPRNFEFYRTKYNIDKKYANKTTTKAKYEKQSGLEQKKIMLQNDFHITNSYYLLNDISYLKNGYEKSDFDDFILKLSLKKILQSGYLQIGSGYRKNQKSQMLYFFNLNKNLTSKLNVKIDLRKNASSNETTWLKIKGEKDHAGFGFSYRFNDRFSFETKIASNRYGLFKQKSIGSAEIYDFSLQQRLKYDYPDILIKEYITVANFTQKTADAILPKSYTQGGIEAYIGQSATYHYNKGWRPYGLLLATYNNLFGLFFGGEFGVCGRLFGSDRLNLSLNYNRSATDEGTLWTVKISHSFIY